MKKCLCLGLLVLLLCASCNKRCRCYTHYGEVKEFTSEELEVYDRTCVGMEDFDLGLRYSLCEWVRL